VRATSRPELGARARRNPGHVSGAGCVGGFGKVYVLFDEASGMPRGVELEIDEFIANVEQAILAGTPIRELGWQYFRPVLRTELMLLGRAVATPRRILDAGCGQGIQACYLAQRGHTVLGVDERCGDIETAADLAQRLGVKVKFRVARIEDMQSSEETFDVIMESAVLPVACRRDISRNWAL